MRLHHVSVIISDLDRALRFYGQVLELRLDPSRPNLDYEGAWLQLSDGAQIHLMCVPDPDAGSVRPSHGGRDRHAALAVPDVDALARRLTAAGIPYTRSRSGRRALF